MIIYLADAIVNVCEGPLYQMMGEDEMLHVYDLWIEAIIDGDVYYHKHIFKGFVECEVPEDCGGGCFNYPNFNAKSEAERLAERVRKADSINTDHWEFIGSYSELTGGYGDI